MSRTTSTLPTELYQTLYERPIYPKNLYLDRMPYTHAEYREEVNKRQIAKMHERGIRAELSLGVRVETRAESGEASVS